MLPLTQRVAFLIFACICVSFGARGFYRLAQRIRAGRADTDPRTDRLVRRIWYSLKTTLSQSRTFRKRPVVSFFHSWIFYGFVFYLLVNAVDAVEGFYPLPISALGYPGQVYLLAADILSAMVLFGVLALILRRFALPSRRDFSFNGRTLLHEDVRKQYISRDSIIVSIFILFHVGSRAAEMGAGLAVEGPDRFQPFATFLSHAFSPQHAAAWRIFGYWGALGSVLAFLAYFPSSKHLHIFMAPIKYAVAREDPSGILPPLNMEIDIEKEMLGAERLEDLAWPRLLDAYACIQCNRCQDVCPATATGKSLSPSALEINKRMELNQLSRLGTPFESGAQSPRPLLAFALTIEAVWGCTTCGACMQVCPVQDEPMLDIIDIRRQQVMMEGKFPAQLQTAFRGMERTKNPWGIAQDSRLAWADGLNVRTQEENPTAEVLYWVGCAASYDPQAQKTARALVQTLEHAGVNYAVLGKKECCTGDSARRAGNEALYLQLAEENVRTLTEAAPKLIIATCPHCMNSIGNEYAQLGGSFAVMHHTEYLDLLVEQGRLSMPAPGEKSVTFHDPCYLGRHNDVYDAPRNLLHVLSNDVRELGRNKENSFCCGAGGAQFWKEEEAGSETISSNRLREAEQVLTAGSAEKVLAVGCPFCKSMLQSTPRSETQTPVVVMDVAELLWENIQRERGQLSSAAPIGLPLVVAATVEQVKSVAPDIAPVLPSPQPTVIVAEAITPSMTVKRQKWVPKRRMAASPGSVKGVSPSAVPSATATDVASASPHSVPEPAQTERKKWSGKPRMESPIAPPSASMASAAATEPRVEAASSLSPASAHAISQSGRKKWPGKRTTDVQKAISIVVAQSDAVAASSEVATVAAAPAQEIPREISASKRKKWPVQLRAGASSEADGKS